MSYPYQQGPWGPYQRGPYQQGYPPPYQQQYPPPQYQQPQYPQQGGWPNGYGTPPPQPQPPNLVIRVMRRDQVPAGIDVIGRVLGEELMALLGDDKGGGNLRPVGVADARQWNIDPGRLWNQGFERLRREPYTLEQMREVSANTGDAPNTLHVVKAAGGTPAASHLARLGELLPAPAPYGTLVLLPAQNTWLFVILRSRSDVNMLPVLTNVARRLQDGEPLARQAYWWMNGNFEQLGLTDKGGGDHSISMGPGLHHAYQAMP